MDILTTLVEEGENLYLEDLEFFETELNTGNYTFKYKSDCMRIINKMKSTFFKENVSLDKGKTDDEGIPSALLVNLSELSSGADPNSPEVIMQNIITIRQTDSYKTNFKEYVAENNAIDEAFIERCFSFFTSWEFSAMLSVKEFSEEFLEKYFGVFDHKKIALYQKFSENFFMKHFSQLDSNTVLNRGKNEWRKKENRSKQLDVFLRLKGVKI